MPANKISLDKAKQNKLFYFVANVVIFRDEDSKFLILKRSENETVHPGKWAIPGGKLEWSDLEITKTTHLHDHVYDFENAIEDLLKREAMEEAGVKIAGPFLFIKDVAFVRPDGIPVMLVSFAAHYHSGEVKLEEEAFSDYMWVSKEELGSYDLIEGVDGEIKKALELFGSH